MSPSSRKVRLDTALVDGGFFPTRSRAQAHILAGNVLVNDVPVTKAGELISAEAVLRLKTQPKDYVSRGAHKLIKALDVFEIPVKGRVALDVGASTGGFTDVLLQRAVGSVVALDVGSNQLDWKIRQDPRVRVIENSNARNLKFEDLGQTFGLITMDISFISILKVLPALKVFAEPATDWITLIKPQFEAGKSGVGKGGIVKSQAVLDSVIKQVKEGGEKLGLHQMGLIESPIKGTKGNQEFLAHWRLAQT